MGVAPLALLSLPILAWVAVGVGVLVAYRTGTSSTVFRLAALFLGFWAIFATTGLLWVLLNGGWSALLALVHAPLLLFQLRYLVWWLAGALGAFVIFLAAFVLSQAVGRGFVILFQTRPLDWPSRLAAPEAPTSLLAFASATPNAFTFTLLERGGPRLLRRRDVILLSEGLLGELTQVEVETVVAHELGHVRELDGRYLTFFRTLSRMMRWDPILAFCADRLTAREELRADRIAVELTGRPRALARALYKASRFAPPAPPAFSASGFLGVGGRRGQRQAAARIRRLMDWAESGRYPEEPGA
ncbi:MAG TPA: M48 family metalloprotease [Thermoplasmata archaeon]|nr:M48 family metalloprotease [Thermoplasmata archaeon]